MLTLSATPYALSLSRPVTTSRRAAVAREGWRVALRHPCGLVGVGEAACWVGFGGGERVTARDLSLLASGAHPALSALDALSLHEASAPVSLGDLEAACAPITSPEARHALELAALDLRAQALNLPLASLLAGAPLPPAALVAPTHALVSDLSEAARAVGEGYGALKMKVGVAPHWSHELMEVARVAALLDEGRGDARVGLRLDANGAWGPKEARACCVVAGSLGVEWVEEPLRSASGGAPWGSWRAVGAAGAAPLGADESASSVALAEESVTLGGARVVTLKPMFLGGLLTALRAAERVSSLGARVCVTHALESSVGRRGAAHLCAALAARGLRPAGGLGGALEGDPSPALPVVAGRVTLEPSPGLGDVRRSEREVR
jgi:L-alanine-DL-glutamate epimerase-like enolase superfamily enzyme